LIQLAEMVSQAANHNYSNQQENFDAKHQIRRPPIGCKLNKLADSTPFLI